MIFWITFTYVFNFYSGSEWQWESSAFILCRHRFVMLGNHFWQIIVAFEERCIR